MISLWPVIQSFKIAVNNFPLQEARKKTETVWHFSIKKIADSWPEKSVQAPKWSDSVATQASHAIYCT